MLKMGKSTVTKEDDYLPMDEFAFKEKDSGESSLNQQAIALKN